MSWLPTVSIVVPVFNGEVTLPDLLTSLRALDYPRDQLDIVFVDNGSTDGTARVLASAGSSIRVEGERVRGPSAARNRGIGCASGDVIAFTDADCTVDPQWLRRLIVPLQDDNVGIAGGAILPRQPCGPIARFGARIHDHEDAIQRCRPAYAITMNWASRREVLEEAAGFDARFLRCEDVDLAYRLQEAGYRLQFVPDAIVYHQNDETLSALFGTGFLHGLHSVHAIKAHRDFVRRFGHKSVNRRSYVRLANTCVRALQRRHRPEASCECVFELGKKLGKVTGSVRHAYVEL